MNVQRKETTEANVVVNFLIAIGLTVLTVMQTRAGIGSAGKTILIVLTVYFWLHSCLSVIIFVNEQKAKKKNAKGKSKRSK